MLIDEVPPLIALLIVVVREVAVNLLSAVETLFVKPLILLLIVVIFDSVVLTF